MLYPLCGLRYSATSPSTTHSSIHKHGSEYAANNSRNNESLNAQKPKPNSEPKFYS